MILRSPHGGQRLGSRIVLALAGGLAPAAIGAVATILVGQTSGREQLVSLLIVWSVIGYSTLSDLGLTRAASRLVAEGHTASSVVRRLWRVSMLLGALLALASAFVLMLAHQPPAILVVLPTLPIAALQFPLVGALEAQGRFGVLAINRSLNAVFGYLLPAVGLLLGTGLAPLLALYSLYRLGSLVTLARHADVDLRRRPPVAEPPEIRGLVSWLAISSLLGPLALYADRVVLGLMSVPQESWIFYTTVSELLIRTYVVPAAVMSVAFPWLVLNLRARAGLIKTVFQRVLPIGSVAVAAGAGLVAGALPTSWLDLAGLHIDSAPLLRVVLALLVAGTALNWSSQLQIGLLHAVGAQKSTATWQLVVFPVFLVALLIVACAHSAGGVAVAVVFVARICVSWLGLALLCASRLGRSPFA